MATGTILLPILGATPDPTNPPAVLFTAANRPYLTFDASTDELCLWTFRMPENYASAPLLKVQYSMVSAVSGDANNEIVIAAEVMSVDDGEDVDTDSFDTPNVSTTTVVPATAGLMDDLSITLTNDGSPSPMAANANVSIRFRRDADNAADDAAGDMEVWAVSLEYTTT